MNTRTLKAEIETLCLDIEQLKQILGAKSIPFDEAERRWISDYRPKARSLAEGLLPYLADRDRMVDYRIGTRHLISAGPGYDLMVSIEAALSEELASPHFDTLVRQFRALSNYLPTEVDA